MFDWKKFSATASAVIGAILAAIAAHNGTVVAEAAAANPEAAGSIWNAWTSIPGLGSIGSLAVSALLHFKSTGRVSPTRAAEIAALSTLAASCMASGDKVGTDLVGQLAAHFKSLDVPAATDKAAEFSKFVEQLKLTTATVK